MPSLLKAKQHIDEDLGPELNMQTSVKRFIEHCLLPAKRRPTLLDARKLIEFWLEKSDRQHKRHAVAALTPNDLTNIDNENVHAFLANDDQVCVCLSLLFVFVIQNNVFITPAPIRDIIG